MVHGDGHSSDVKVGKTTDTGSVAQLSHDVGVRMVGEAYPIRTAMSLPVSSPGDQSIAAAPVMAPPPVIDSAPFDKGKSVSQLIQDGSITRADVPGPAPEVAKPGTQAAVTVTYADASSNDPTKVPDIIIKKDGTIQATGDFESLQRKNVVVQVERTPGDTSDPNDAQKNSIDKVVSYVYDRLSADPTVAQNGLKLNDEFGLISDDLVKKLATNGDPGVEPSIADSRRNYSPESQQAMSQMSRMTPGSEGSMSRGDVERHFPQRDVPTLEGETDKVQDTKNAVAAMFNPDKAAPYETLRSTPDRGYEAGRYGMSYPLMRNYFSSFGGDLDEMDEDGFMAMLGKLDKEGKLPKAFKRFKNKDGSFNKEAAGKFLKFAHAMKEGKGLTSADVKENLPKEMQEQMAMSLVDKFNKAGGDNAGKTALAFHLGKGPDQFTQADLDDKGNKEYMRSADRLAQLSGVRHGMGENDRLDYKINMDGTSMDAKIVNRAFSHARAVGTTGWCAKETQIAWASAAPELMGSGDGVQMGAAFARSNKFQQVDWQTAQEAMQNGKAVTVTRQWANGANHGGHVATLAMQNGRVMEASDHVTQFNRNNGRYIPSRDKFFVYKGGEA